MTAQLTLGVIGHVDHGKTALVRALTGIDTDRLQEEKERGLSIVLGFSYLEGPNGTIDFIDVPGHENFVRTMISGATGIDAALLVVAADDAVMPQTREHVEITELLGVDRGVVAINKCDLVSEDELARIVSEVRSFLADTFLESSDVICVSATSKLGVDQLEQALYRLEPVRERRGGINHPYLPIDRVFAMKGFGPVVTGTLRGGELTTNTSVELLPREIEVTIRAMQVHNQSVDRAAAGQRVAVNLRHIKLEDIDRGDVLALRGCVKATRCLDVEFELLESCKNELKDSATIRYLAGTTESMARLRLLNCNMLEPGTRAFAQLLFHRDVTTYRSERFIIRSESPVLTIGGGIVLDPHAERHRRFDRVVLDRLATAAHGKPAENLRMLIARAGLAGTSAQELGEILSMDADEVQAALAGVQTVNVGARKLVDPSAYAGLTEAIITELSSYHRANPSHPGIAAAKLRSNLADEPAEDVYRHAVNKLISDTRIENHGGHLRLAGFDPLAALTKQERLLAAELEDAFRMRRLAPTYRDQVVGHDKTRRNLFDLLCDSDRLVRLKTHGPSDDFVVHVDIFEEAVADIETHFAYPQKFTVSEVRKLLGANRKFTVPFMEFLDATGVTIRFGDLRQLRMQREQENWR